MKPLYLLAASTLALAAAACGPRTPAVRSALECPAKQGDLTRTSAAPDGKACSYVTSKGAEVTLQLVSVQGGVDRTLSAIETNLLANRQKPKADEGAKAEAAKDSAPKDEAIGREAIDEAVDKAVKEAMADAGQSATAEVSKDGGATRLDLPGVHIVTNGDDDTNVKVGPIRIDAGGDGATVRIRRDVRMRGEALNPKRRGMRAMFLYTGDDLPDGYRFVGFEAGGPKVGPITVAVVKSKTEDIDGNELYSDVKKLVRRNGGV